MGEHLTHVAPRVRRDHEGLMGRVDDRNGRMTFSRGGRLRIVLGDGEEIRDEELLRNSVEYGRERPGGFVGASCGYEVERASSEILVALFARVCRLVDGAGSCSG